MLYSHKDFNQNQFVNESAEWRKVAEWRNHMGEENISLLIIIIIILAKTLKMESQII